MGRWRAAVLILVHVAIAAHIVQWLVSGLRDEVRTTLSPVEPSETMYTLELGEVNAGFILFMVAIASTLILGRFFCGWACHVVALQDLCAWLMKRAGITPKPWRSRLLLWVPLGLAVYMFVWPTLRRLAVAPLVQQVLGEVPVWLGKVTPFDGFVNHLIVEDFWRTFPPWYIAVPFLLVCGFATVYFLGSKGFCNYGCPYGGFFGPADRLSPVRIRVTDDCKHCGHCTAVCTSNVRVSEEVWDYGMVVDPGCMKCLDCVSACPEQALYVGAGAPAAFAKPRTTPQERAGRDAARRARFDLSLPEELACLAVFMVLLLGLRWNTAFGLETPLLFAAGIAGIGAYGAQRTWRMLTDLHVRATGLQLKLSGRVRPAGAAFALVTLVLMVLGAQGLVINTTTMIGDWQIERLQSLRFAPATSSNPRTSAGANVATSAQGTRAAPADADAGTTEGAAAAFGGTGDAAASSVGRLVTADDVYADGYTPDPRASRLAESGIAWYGRAAPLWEGGWALYRPWSANVRLSYLYAVAGRWAESESAVRRAIQQRSPTDDLVLALTRAMERRGADRDEVRTELAALVQRFPSLEATRQRLAEMLLDRGAIDEGLSLMAGSVRATPWDSSVVIRAAAVHVEMDRAGDALKLIDAGLAQRPASTRLLTERAALLLATGDVVGARAAALRAVELEPHESAVAARLAVLLPALNAAEAIGPMWEALNRREPRDALAAREHARWLAATGNASGARRVLESAVERLPRAAGLWAELSRLRRLGGDAPGADGAAERAKALAPGDAGVLRLIVEELLATEPGRAKALELYDAATAANPARTATIRDAVTLAMGMNQRDRAERILTRAIAARSSGGVAGNAALLADLAGVRLAKGDLVGSSQAVVAAMALKPTQPDVVARIASVLNVTNRSTEAMPLFERALRANPGDALLARDAANMASQLGEITRAAEILRRAVARRPTVTSARAQYALVLLAINNRDEAQRQTQEALSQLARSLTPPDEQTVSFLAQALLALGDEPAAQRLLQQFRPR